MFKLSLVIAIFTSSIYSQQIDSVKQSIHDNSIMSTDSSYFKNTSVRKIENYWGLHIGYFPDTNDNVYTSQGIGVMLNMEDYSGRLFNWGWYFIVRKTFEDDGESQKTGSASLGASLSYHFSNKYNTFLLKVGFGLRTPPYVHVSTLFVLEYQYQIMGGVLLSLALTEEIIQFRGFSSPLISLGIIL